MKFFLVITAFLISANKLFAQTKLTPTDAGSKVHFVIKNFAINTGGDFTGLKGSITFDAGNIGAAVFNVTVDAATIDTDNGKRDGHLKKPEYFDVAKYPTVHIVSSKIEKTSNANAYSFTGNLTIKGVTRQVQFQFMVHSLNGGYLFTGGFDINRRDFNVGGSSFSMADNAKISLSIFAK